MTELCEWNPGANKPATIENGQHTGCQNEATLSVGKASNWHLCSSCAQLPPFRRLTARQHLRGREMSKPNFYVAISKDNRDIGIASVVGLSKKDVSDFYKEYASHEIRICDGEEMKRLMLAGLSSDLRDQLEEPPLGGDEVSAEHQSAGLTPIEAAIKAAEEKVTP
jgi:hypothetical protein